MSSPGSFLRDVVCSRTAFRAFTALEKAWCYLRTVIDFAEGAAVTVPTERLWRTLSQNRHHVSRKGRKKSRRGRFRGVARARHAFKKDDKPLESVVLCPTDKGE